MAQRGDEGQNQPGRLGHRWVNRSDGNVVKLAGPGGELLKLGAIGLSHEDLREAAVDVSPHEAVDEWVVVDAIDRRDRRRDGNRCNRAAAGRDAEEAAVIAEKHFVLTLQR